jgi:tryptophan synthase beta chain
MAETTRSSLGGSTYFSLDLQVKRKEERRAAPEVAHAIRAAIDLALEAREASERRIILFNLCGHRHFDLAAYEQYLAGELVDHKQFEKEIEKAIISITG